jgi:prepilin-type N-terminal cleavage/methylation domain-containing protein
MHSYRRAFTLIELLVVIAIIAILAAILFPVFAQAKTAAKKAAHISNLKQGATALVLYQGDADDRLPLAPCRPTGHGYPAKPCDEFSRRATWRLTTIPYIKNKEMYVPPGYDYPSSFNPATVFWFGVNYAEEAKAGVKPGMAALHSWAHDEYHGYHGLSSTEVPRPASIILVMPSRYEFGDLGTWTLNHPWLDTTKGPMQSYNKRVNYAMMDSHVITRNPCSTFGALRWADGTTPDDDFLWEWFSHIPSRPTDPIRSSWLRDWQRNCNKNPEYK